MKQLFILLSLLLLQSSLYAINSPDTTTAKEASSQKLQFIEISAVPTKATQLHLALKKIDGELTEKESTYEIHQAIPSYAESIDAILNDPVYQNLDKQNKRILTKLHNSWIIYEKQLKSWNKILQERIQVYDKNREILEQYSILWAQTHINANKHDAPELIENHITNVIIEIETLRNRAKGFYDALLSDTNLVSVRLQNIAEAKEKIQKAQKVIASQIFEANDLNIIDAFRTQSFVPMYYIDSIIKHLMSNVEAFRIYHEDNLTKALYLLVYIIFIGSFIAYFNYLYRHKRLFVKEESQHKNSYFFIGRPFSIFLILTELCVVFLYPDSPKGIRQLELLFILIPFFRILQTVIPVEIINYFYAYFILYTFNLIQKNGEGFYLEDRVLNLLLTLLLMFLITYVWRKKLLDFIQLRFMKKFIYTILPILSLILLASLILNTFGLTFLSKRMTEGVFAAIHASIIFFVLTIILTGYLVILFRRRVSSASNLLDIYARNLERIISTGIKLVMFLWWGKIVLVLFGINEKVVEIREAILAFSWTIATTTISIQSIVNFTLILVGTWALSKFVRIILEVEIFSRYTLPRGFPTAITTVLNYMIVITGVIIALSSLGISTEQFVLVFGALGVGIGFGLRNIIANFVSGIIMVFERPIQIGDTIEIDTTTGKVVGIGTRASYIQTFDGSEVIIPNADFIASKVTNWTLSDERRRKVLLFKVDFESDIDEVLKIMHETASSHPDVLHDPEPLATFNAFGEYYLEFKLYFWLTENLIVAQSDIAIGVYRSLKAAGIKMPLPKQEITKHESL